MGNPTQDSLSPNKLNQSNAKKEFLAGGDLGFGKSLSSLRNDADVLSARFGTDTVERMLKDPEIKKCLTVLKIGVLDNDISFHPSQIKPLSLQHKHDGEHTHGFHCAECEADDNEKADAYLESKKYSDFLNRSVARLEKPLRTTLSSMLEGLFHGHKIAELVWGEVYDDVLKADVFIPTAIRVKKKGTVKFVVDAYSKVVGIQGVCTIAGVARTKTVQRQGKFLVFTHDEKDEDPRGTPKLEAIYNAWWLKSQVFPEYLTWLKQCAIPQLIGTLPANTDRLPIIDISTGIQIIDAHGQPVYEDAATDMLGQMVKMKNATAMVIPHGASVSAIGNTVSGDPFKSMIDALNGEMEMGLLLQTLATSDSRNNTRAASQTHISVMEGYVRFIKKSLLTMITEDYVKHVLELNFPGYNKALLPITSAGDGSKREWAADVTAVSRLYSSGFLTESQLPGIDKDLNLLDRHGTSLGVLWNKSASTDSQGTVSQDHEDPEQEHGK